MELLVKESAALALKKLNLNHDDGIRIEAIFVGSCSLYKDHYLWIDKKTNEDKVLIIDSIPFLVSNESKQHLPQKLILDYNPTLGYKLSSTEETYKYNLSIKRR